MAVTGIIAEFNPLHNGHYHLINTAKNNGTVVCVISGNFVQRGDTAILEKRVRTELALLCGADLVLELPVCWSMSTAQNFALGGVSILDNIGCDRLIFGSECGDIAELERTCNILKSDSFSQKTAKFLETGITFASARESAAIECGASNGILSGANNNLAIEYMLAAKSIGSEMSFSTVKRVGAMHDSSVATQGFASASIIREKLLSGESNFVESVIPNQVEKLILNGNFSSIKQIENSVLAILRSKTIKDLSNLPDLSEGIENKLFSSIRLATSLEELYNTIKVKRYTMARIRRLVLSATIGIDSSFFMKQPPYLRVLGFNKKGEDLIKSNISRSNIPIVMRVGEISDISLNAQKVFDVECRATDLYTLSLKNPLPCGLEYNSKLIKVE